jgi:hypothetical protein
MFLKILFDQLLYKNPIFDQRRLIDLDLQNVLMEKKITQETDGFSNESLSLLMVAN